MKKWRQLIAGFAVLTAMSVVLVGGPTASAINVFQQCKDNPGSAVCGSKNDDASNSIKNVINILLFVLGMISVLMIVIGGVRYTTSGGDSSSTKGAKDTILYSIVGLIIAMLSYAIVNFVVGYF